MSSMLMSIAEFTRQLIQAISISQLFYFHLSSTHPLPFSTLANLNARGEGQARHRVSTSRLSASNRAGST